LSCRYAQRRSRLVIVGVAGKAIPGSDGEEARVFKAVAGGVVGYTVLIAGAGLWLAGIALLGVWEMLSLPRFVDDVARLWHVHPAVIYATPVVLAVLAVWGFGEVETKLARRKGDWLWPTVAGFAYATSLALVCEAFWLLLIGSLVHGVSPANRADIAGPLGDVVRAIPSTAGLAPSVVIAIGAGVGLPFAIRTFWKSSPLYRSQGRIYLIHRRDASTKETGKTRWSGVASAISGAQGTVRRTSLSMTALLRASFMWAGLVVAVGTFCGIAAGFSRDVAPLQAMLAVVASLAAGFVAAVQWKMSTKQ
jgi:hypothetical protein